jgi:uncharacterized protein (DUF58 family)
VTPAPALLLATAALVLLAALDLAQRLLSGAPGIAFALWSWGGSALLVLALADVVLSRAWSGVAGERLVPGSLALGQWRQVVLRLAVAAGNGAVERLDVHDGVPAGADVRGLPRRVRLRPGEGADITYELLPQRRGELVFAGARLRRWSRLGLWTFLVDVPLVSRARVYPDFAQFGHYLRLHAAQRTAALGVHRRRRQGDGLEFLQLRDYRSGDALRQVDWKATSRRRKLIAREYEAENDQQVLFVLDCGRRMRHRDGIPGHFDAALNALLLLARVALRQGDAVGLLVTGARQRWLPMRRGADAASGLLHAIHDLEADTSASDFLAAARAICVRQQRRALVVWLTNLQDGDDDLLPALSLLRGRHLVLLTSLRESVVDDIAAGEVRDVAGAVLVAAAAGHVAERHRLRERLARAGHLLLDCTPAALPVRLVDDYWRLKASGRL